MSSFNYRPFIQATDSSVDTLLTDMQEMNAKLNEDCTGEPINVKVCNPSSSNVDLSTIEAYLAAAITQLQAVNANTDTLEASLANVISEIQTGNATLVTISLIVANTLTELQQINANTDNVENILSSTQALLQSEFDQTQVLLANIESNLQTLNAKLNEDCAGNPVNVTVCNPTSVDLSTIEASLASAVTELQAVNANTDTLEASFATTIAEIQSGNATLVTINTTVTNALTELQQINANTVNVETILTNTQTLLQSEFDETQVFLSDIRTELTGITTLLTKTTEVVVEVHEDRTVNSTIPAGFIHGSIGVVSGSITINGATYNEKDSFSLPPMPCPPSTDRRYPAQVIVVTGGPGTVYRVHEVR